MKASNWRVIDKGALKGTFTLALPSGLVIHGNCLFRKDAREWVAGPSRQIKNGDQVQYQPIVEFADRETSDEFTTDALAALAELGVTP